MHIYIIIIIKKKLKICDGSTSHGHGPMSHSSNVEAEHNLDYKIRFI